MNRRGFKRFPIDGMGIRCRMLSGADVSLLNLSTEGAYIVTSEKLEKGAGYTLEVEQGGQTRSIKGTVVSVEPAGIGAGAKGGKGPLFVTGLRFSSSYSEEGRGALDLIGSNADLRTIKGKVSDLRVKAPGQKAPAEGFSVKKISFGGLQFETVDEMGVESSLRMEIVLPGGKKPLSFIGRVASCQEVPESSPKRFSVGMEYIEMNTGDLVRLKDFIYFIQDLEK